MNNENNSPSIRSRIIQAMLILAAVMLLILWISQTILLSGIYQYIKENDIDQVADLINDNIDNENSSALYDQIALQHETCIIMVNMSKDEELIYNSHSLNDCIIHKLSINTIIDNWYMDAVKNDGRLTKIISREELLDSYYNSESFNGKAPDENSLSKCILTVNVTENTKGETLVFVLNSAIEPVTATVRTLRFQLVCISIILTAVCIIISFFLSKRIASPIINMSADVKKLSLGNYDVKFDESGTEETVELAKTLNHMTEELSKVDKLQKELIANISHDLRTPLTMISGYSEVMRDIPGENTPENMQVIIDETARLSSLVNDLLNVSRLQDGSQTLNLKRLNLTESIRNTITRYDHLVSHEGYDISFEYERDVYIMADEIRVLQVVYNLINNAINYSGENKKITVRQEMNDGKVKILVIDNGYGISEEDLHLIWDRYYKVDRVHKRAKVGTGLGLSIVKNILKLHNCPFGVSSELNKGSTFWFEFNIIE